MALDVYNTVSNCISSSRNSSSAEHRCQLHLFPARKPLKPDATDVLRPLPRPTKRNQNVVIFSDCYSKLTQAVPAARINKRTEAKIFFDAWVIPYGIPVHLLTDTDIQFVSKLFEMLYNNLGTKHITTTAYHSRPISQEKQ